MVAFYESARSLCTFCSSLRLADLANPSGCRLHATVRELKECAPDCYLCRTAYTVACGTGPIRSKSRVAHWLEDDGRQDSLCVAARYSLNKPQGRPDPRIQIFEVAVYDVDDYEQRSPLSQSGIWVYAWFLDSDVATLPDIPRLRSLPASTSAPSTLALANQWAENCISGKCWSLKNVKSAAAIAPRQKPGRLLDISAFDLPRVVDGNASNGLYVALSYTWGSAPADWRTVTANISARRRGFSINELPKTLIDAVRITQALQVTYLWIDSICIVQDDAQDWAREAAKMADVYANAYVTIAADASSGSHAGIFNEASGSWSHFDGMEFSGITDTDENGRPVTLMLYAADPAHQWGDEVEGSKLATRGWCCQESILSPRILHFTNTQLFWECRHCVRSEDGYMEMYRRPDSSRLGDLKGILSLPEPNPRFDPSSHKQKFAPSRRALIEMWYYVIQDDYSARKLTYGSDKLIAVAGIAKAIQRRTSMRYYAGMWELLLTEGLCWSRTIVSRDGGKLDAYRAPSWSWASQDGQLSFHMASLEPELDHKHAQVAGVAVTLAGEDKCGAVSHGSLELSAPTIRDAAVKLRDPDLKYHADPEPDQDPGLPSGDDWYDVPPPDVRNDFVRAGECDTRSETVLELENGDWLTAIMDTPRTQHAIVDACLMFEEWYYRDKLENKNRHVRLHFILLQPRDSHSSDYIRVGYAVGDYSWSDWIARKASFLASFERTIFTVC